MDVKPSRAWYWIAGAVFIVGVGAAITLFVITLTGVLGQIERFDTPGARTVRLDKGEKRGIYFHPGDRGTCSVSPPVELKEYDGASVEVDSEDFGSAFRFEAPRAGRYEVRCQNERPSRAAIGPKLEAFGLVGRILMMIGAGLVGLLGGATIAVVTFVLRKRSRGS